MRSKAPSASAEVARVSALCAKLGGKIEFISRDEFSERERAYVDARDRPRFYPAPGCSWYGFVWRTKLILSTFIDADAGRLIHEMGHVFLDRGSPDRSDEFSWLGWEICAARATNVWRTWSRQNETYIIETSKSAYGDWGTISRGERAALIKDRIAVAQAAGIVDARGQPKARR